MPLLRTQPRHGAFWTTLTAALALSACLTDGPNHTGAEYLDGHGLKLETPLYKVDLKGFPVDSFWTGDVEPGHLGDTVMLLGASNGFEAQARLGFDISDTNFIDSLGTDTSSASDGLLRLSVGFLLHQIGYKELKATLKPDTLRILVETWAHKDPGYGKDERVDTLRVHNRRFLVNQDTSVLLPGVPVLDTFFIRLDSAYSRDSLQAANLRNLRKVLIPGASEKKSKWTLYQQLSYIPEDSADTGAMLRLGGAIGTKYSYSPFLLFGKPASVKAASIKTQKVGPLVVGNVYGVTYKLRFLGNDASMLVGKTRGLHIRVKRERFLDSIGKALALQGIPMRRAADGEFDLSWFVPFAKVTLPLDTQVRVDGNFPLEMLMSTDLDSLLPAPDPRAASRITLALGGSAAVANVYERNNPSKRLDSLVAEFVRAPQDSGLRRIIVRSTKDTSAHDTAWLAPGQSREMAWSLNGNRSLDRLIFVLRAGDSSATVDVHVNTKNAGERQTFRDPTTGEFLTTLTQRLPHFLTPRDTSVTLRATGGIQRLFNRVRMDKDFDSDLFMQPAVQAAVDTSYKLRVPWPVLGEIRPRLDSGALKLDISLYLYPLKDR